jgi:hypothetical protein
MTGGRRRGFTDLIIESLGAVATAASPLDGEAAGADGLQARLHGGLPSHTGTHAQADFSGAAVWRTRP